MVTRRPGFLVAEVEVGEIGLCPVGGELDGGREWFVEHERVPVKAPRAVRTASDEGIADGCA